MLVSRESIIFAHTFINILAQKRYYDRSVTYTNQMIRKIILVLMIMLVSAPAIFAQKFTKREQARREAREANYFCGASFTFTAGYTHSWLNNSPISLKANIYGKSERWANTRESFNVGFLWDQAISRQWGIQTGLFYNDKGGEHLFYYDNGLGYGPILRSEETDKVNAQSISLQSVCRYFIPLGKYSRISVNGGFFIDRHIHKPGNFSHWNLGPQVGLGYDWKHLSLSATYQPGIFQSITDNSNTGLGAVLFNAGFRIWRK